MCRRIQKLEREISDLQKNPPENIRVDQDWNFYITGPEDSPYSGTEVKLEVRLVHYPFLPPKITMVTKPPGLFFNEGNFEVFMRRKWKPCYNVVSRVQEFADFIFYPGRLKDSGADAVVTENKVRKRKKMKLAKFFNYQNISSNFCAMPLVWPSVSGRFVKFK